MFGFSPRILMKCGKNEKEIMGAVQMGDQLG